MMGQKEILNQYGIYDLIQNMLTQISSLGVNIDFLQIQSIDFDKKLISCDNLSMIESNNFLSLIYSLFRPLIMTSKYPS